MMNNLDDLRVFERVEALQSFTAAARELGLSKAAVSQRVARLEARLGVRLLQRTTRSVRATDVGQNYAERCRQILADVRETDAAARSTAVVPRGLLRLTSPRLFGSIFLTPVLARVLRDHADLQAEVLLTERRVDLVAEGFDLALRVGRLADTDLVSRSLGETVMIEVASPAGARDALVLGPHQRGARAAVDSLEMARDLAIAGLGRATLPRFLCRAALHEGTLVQLGPAGPGFPIQVVYPARRHLAARVRIVVDALVEAAERAPWR